MKVYIWCIYAVIKEENHNEPKTIPANGKIIQQTTIVSLLTLHIFVSIQKEK